MDTGLYDELIIWDPNLINIAGVFTYAINIVNTGSFNLLTGYFVGYQSSFDYFVTP